MRSRWSLIALLEMGALVGCAAPQRFLPASDVERSAGDPSAGVASRGGITLVANAEPWRGDPATLSQLMTPIHVRLLNHSDRALAVRHQTFVLRSDTDRELRPLPPIVAGASNEAAARRAPKPDAHGFHFAPHYRDALGEEVRYWTGGFAFDPHLREGSAEWRPHLPTDAMVLGALPEGVLEAGGWVSGFLYFERVDPDAQHLTLHVDLDLPQGEERVATIEIAFVDASG